MEVLVPVINLNTYHQDVYEIPYNKLSTDHWNVAGVDTSPKNDDAYTEIVPYVHLFCPGQVVDMHDLGQAY